ncbi:GntR family transcriptional regulator [Streptomyces sp. SID4928]|uniref:GntR family transcriptional regulator n=1 Tax=unclassified Streptomyces TaxID=2593676 RepID=UPI0001C1C98A|nr:GntR family transcriptional regulator [Streptomyces sp. ACT-1]EGE40818.1 transcriptional regulator, GntR family [Streptomyces sp. ACT-1]MYR48888.1 GntR family transcriptional regulator [Streptomyces sp. SID4928]
MTNDPTSERTALYRFYDADGNLLYVGITKDTQHRFASHRRTKSWWPEVDRNEIAWLDSPALAEEAEKEAIAREKPRHNVSANAMKVAKLTPPGKRVGYKDIADDLRRAILSGEYAPGSRLPGLNQLMREYASAESTVRQAFATLKSEELIRSRQGAGIFVRDLDANRKVAVPADQPQQAADLLARHMSPSALRELAQELMRKVQP